jgi:hypothetical protein
LSFYKGVGVLKIEASESEVLKIEESESGLLCTDSTALGTTSKPLTVISLYKNGLQNTVLKTDSIIYYGLYITFEEAMCGSRFVLPVEMTMAACQ